MYFEGVWKNFPKMVMFILGISQAWYQGLVAIKSHRLFNPFP